MLATLASAAAAPPLAPPGAADAPTLDLYVGDERRTTIATNFGTATEALLVSWARAASSSRCAVAARSFAEPLLRPDAFFRRFIRRSQSWWMA